MSKSPLAKVKRFVMKGGPLLHGSQQVSELALDGRDLLENVRAFKMSGGVDEIIKLELTYILIDSDIELNPDEVKHRLLLQKNVTRMGPDMEMGSYMAYEMEEYGDSLPDAMRRLADRIEAEGVPDEVPVPLEMAL